MLMDFFFPSLLTLSVTRWQRKTNTKTADPWAVSSNLEEKIKGSGDHWEICGSCLQVPSATSSQRSKGFLALLCIPQTLSIMDFLGLPAEHPCNSPQRHLVFKERLVPHPGECIFAARQLHQSEGNAARVTTLSVDKIQIPPDISQGIKLQRANLFFFLHKHKSPPAIIVPFLFMLFIAVFHWGYFSVPSRMMDMSRCLNGDTEQLIPVLPMWMLKGWPSY